MKYSVKASLYICSMFVMSRSQQIHTTKVLSCFIKGKRYHGAARKEILTGTPAFGIFIHRDMVKFHRDIEN